MLGLDAFRAVRGSDRAGRRSGGDALTVQQRLKSMSAFPARQTEKIVCRTLSSRHGIVKCVAAETGSIFEVFELSRVLQCVEETERPV